jgi:hypothetical protein
MIVILILPELFSWEDAKSMFLKCRGPLNRAAILLRRIIVTPAPQDLDLLEAD